MQNQMQKLYIFALFFRTSYKIEFYTMFFLHFPHNTGILMLYGFLRYAYVGFVHFAKHTPLSRIKTFVSAVVFLRLLDHG